MRCIKMVLGIEDMYAPAETGVLLGAVLRLAFDAWTLNSSATVQHHTDTSHSQPQKDSLCPVEMATGHSGGISWAEITSTRGIASAYGTGIDRHWVTPV